MGRRNEDLAIQSAQALDALERHSVGELALCCGRAAMRARNGGLMPEDLHQVRKWSGMVMEIWEERRRRRLGKR